MVITAHVLYCQHQAAVSVADFFLRAWRLLAVRMYDPEFSVKVLDTGRGTRRVRCL